MSRVVVHVQAIVVTYQPVVEELAELIQALAPQVDGILVVDNTPMANPVVEELCGRIGIAKVEVIRLGGNLGIAKAFNVGIEAASKAGATHVLLSDQDSQPDPDMVKGLLDAERQMRGQGERVAAVGPSFININSGVPFPFLVEKGGSLLFGRRDASEMEPHVEAITLISSGTLIPMVALHDIGLMREEFFIDKVDLEWCYRARAHGYKLYGTGWARMQHRMGDSRLRVWYFGRFDANEYSPLRVYYQVRNLVRLHFLGYAGIRWRLRTVWSILGIFYFHVLFGNARIAALKMGLRGIFDGLRGRMGKFTA